jgi:hypothetical protein
MGARLQAAGNRMLAVQQLTQARRLGARLLQQRRRRARGLRLHGVRRAAQPLELAWRGVDAHRRDLRARLDAGAAAAAAAAARRVHAQASQVPERLLLLAHHVALVALAVRRAEAQDGAGVEFNLLRKACNCRLPTGDATSAEPTTAQTSVLCS